MSTLVNSSSVRLLRAGNLVSRAAANLPQTAQTPMYTISGGRVMIQYFVLQITTIVQAQATTVQFIATPTAGTAVNLTNSTGDINGKEVGASVTFATTLGGTAVVNNAGANVLAAPVFVMNPGTLDFKTVASSTGAFKIDLIYVPLDTGASVVTA
jgi:hypothetical protein